MVGWQRLTYSIGRSVNVPFGQKYFPFISLMLSACSIGISVFFGLMSSTKPIWKPTLNGEGGGGQKHPLALWNEHWDTCMHKSQITLLLCIITRYNYWLSILSLVVPQVRIWRGWGTLPNWATLGGSSELSGNHQKAAWRRSHSKSNTIYIG